MADIAREADVSYGLVYHYFKNKEELFDAAPAGWWDGLDEMLDRGPTVSALALSNVHVAADRVIGPFADNILTRYQV